MNHYRPKHILYGLLFWTLAAVAMAFPAFSQEESLTLDPITGNYHLRYLEDGNRIVEMTWVPATKVKPNLKSWFLAPPSGVILYRYTVAVEAKSSQALSSFGFDASQAIGTRNDKPIINFPQGIPMGWKGRLSPTFRSKGISVAWFFAQHNDQGTAGLQPGQKQGGFYVDSKDLPGVGTVRLYGSTPLQGFPGEGPGESEVGLKLREVQMGFVPRLAAIPRISVSTPFNAAGVLSNIQKHVKEDMASMQLIDPVLLGLIDRGLTQAIAAAQGGNTISLLHEIKNLRKILKTGTRRRG